MANLKTDYRDFIPVEGERIFNIKRENGTIVETNIVLEDVTVYENGGGDTFGATDMNGIGVAVNGINAQFLITATVGGWSTTAPYTQTIATPDAIDQGGNVFPTYGLKITGATVSERKEQNNSFAMITTCDVNNGSVVLTCDESVPTVNLPIVITLP